MTKRKPNKIFGLHSAANRKTYAGGPYSCQACRRCCARSRLIGPSRCNRFFQPCPKVFASLANEVRLRCGTSTYMNVSFRFAFRHLRTLTTVPGGDTIRCPLPSLVICMTMSPRAIGNVPAYQKCSNSWRLGIRMRLTAILRPASSASSLSMGGSSKCNCANRTRGKSLEFTWPVFGRGRPPPGSRGGR